MHSQLKRMGSKALLTAMIGLSFGAAPAAAEVIFIGPVSTRDFIVANFLDGAEKAAALAQSQAEFQAELTQARKAYFTASPSSRSEAGRKFGRLLFQKDLLLASPKLAGSGNAIVEGQAAALSTVMGMFTNGGREFDDGIPPSASPAFRKWVQAVSKRGLASGGPTRDPSTPAVFTAPEVESAYEEYRQLRDKAELDDWDYNFNNKPAPLVGAAVFMGSFYLTALNPGPKRFQWEARRVESEVLHCTYNGRRLLVFDFWKDAPPESIGILMALNPPATSPIQDHTTMECPADTGLARSIYTQPVKRLSREETKQVLSMRNEVPPSTPYDGKKRKACFSERNAAYQEAGDDPAARTAVQVQFMACMR